MQLVDALMVALGSCFESLSNEDVQAIRDMYTAVPSMELVANAAEGKTKSSPDPAEQGTLPHMLIENGGNEAAGSPVTSIAAAQTKETLFSLEDELSLDNAPSGDTPFHPHLRSTPPW